MQQAPNNSNGQGGGGGGRRRRRGGRGNRGGGQGGQGGAAQAGGHAGQPGQPGQGAQGGQGGGRRRRGGRKSGGGQGGAPPAPPAGAGAAAAPAAAPSVDVSAELMAAAGLPPPPPLPFMTQTLFSSLPLTPEVQLAITRDMGLHYLTEIQDKAILRCMGGEDCMGRAKTGTGKTVSFLVPALERVLAMSGPQGTGEVEVLCVSPNRELTRQIETQARLLTTHLPGVSVGTVFGGTNISKDRRLLQAARAPRVLVATPGRLLDHLKNLQGFAQRLSGLRVLILDEADQLLEQGFRPDIERILGYLPRERQTLLFSATMPEGVRQIMGLALNPNHFVADCINDKLAGSETNAQVEQHVTVMNSLDEQVAVVYQLILQAQQRDPDDHKIIVFFPTARLAGFFAQMFNDGLNVPCLEIHSRKSQGHRTRTSDNFRKARAGILFSSDVSARGVDYPNVSLVLQVGLPDNKQQYVHRLGRTARAGRLGVGVLVLAPYETRFQNELRGLPLQVDPPVTPSPEVQATVSAGLAQVSRNGALRKAAEQAYQAWLGYYNGNLRRLCDPQNPGGRPGWDKPTLVQWANHFATTIGLDQPPALRKSTVGKMGLRGTPGLRVEGVAEGQVYRRRR